MGKVLIVLYSGLYCLQCTSMTERSRENSFSIALCSGLKECLWKELISCTNWIAAPIAKWSHSIIAHKSAQREISAQTPGSLYIASKDKTNVLELYVR